jgi:hypothetical protein
MHKVKIFIKRNLFTFVGVLIGALGGYLYWYHIGCSSGTCPITSSSVNSLLYGALMGGLLFSMITIGDKNQENKKS